MSVSAIFGSKLVLPPPFAAATKEIPPPQRLAVGGGYGGTGLVIECSSRPQKKGTKHHMKTRPRKTCPSDRRHGPAVYPPLPALPSEWSFVSDDSAAVSDESAAVSDESSAVPDESTVVSEDSTAAPAIASE